jgi:hypothetical protein
METYDDIRLLFPPQIFRFQQFGFELQRFVTIEGVHLTIVFEEEADTLNKVRSYHTLLTASTLESTGFTLFKALQLIEQTYYDYNNCLIDYHEKSNPSRFILKIYEQEYYETLLSIEFKPITED